MQTNSQRWNCGLTKAGSGSHHGVESRGDAVGAGPAPVLKDDPVVVVVGHLFHGDAHNPPGDGAHRHAGDEETRRDLKKEMTRNVSKKKINIKRSNKFCLAADLHAEGKDSDDHLEDQGEGQLPQGVVDARPRWPVRDVVHRPTHVGVVDVVAQLRRLQRATVVEELRDELAGAAPGVRVGEGQHGRDARHGDHLQHRVLAQLRGLAPPAPGDVGPDEQSPPQAAEDAQQDEGHQLGHVPRRVVLNIEEHQAAVAKGVDGAQSEGSNQRGEERTPQSFEGEIVADLQERRGT